MVLTVSIAKHLMYKSMGSIAQVPSNRFCTVQSTFNRPIECLTVQSNFLPSNQFFNRPNKLGLGLDLGLGLRLCLRLGLGLGLGVGLSLDLSLGLILI